VARAERQKAQLSAGGVRGASAEFSSSAFSLAAPVELELAKGSGKGMMSAAMNTILVRFLSLAVVCMPVCALCKEGPPATAEKAAARDGSSYEKAIVAKSVPAEYAWLKKKYPGYALRRQSLRTHDGKPFDVLEITLKGGKEIEVYFDISSFFGK
jgi:hypothetical protein